MLDTKIYTDKSITKIKCDAPDIPIINYDNAILFIEKDTDYTKLFKIPTITLGLTIHKGKYFYFNHNIVETPKTFLNQPNSVHSYDIYQITKDLAENMIESKKVNICEIKFNSFFNFGEYFTSIRRGNYIETYRYESRKSDGKLIMPHSISPSDLQQGITIEDYLKNHRKKYPPKITEELSLNRDILRDIILNDILD